MSLRFFPVFVNHITGTVTAADIRSLFSRFGVVTDVVIVDDYGFVNMATAEDAFLVIEEINGRGLHSSLLHVDFSEEMKQYLLQRGTTFRCTPDPYTGVVGVQHPAYPCAEGIIQPLIPDAGYGALINDKEFLDERLKIINAELEKLKENKKDRSLSRRRSRSPYYSGSSRRRSRSYERDSRRRDSRHAGRERSRDKHRRSGSRGTDSRRFDRDAGHYSRGLEHYPEEEGHSRHRDRYRDRRSPGEDRRMQRHRTKSPPKDDYHYSSRRRSVTPEVIVDFPRRSPYDERYSRSHTKERYSGYADNYRSRSPAKDFIAERHRSRQKDDFDDRSAVPVRKPVHARLGPVVPEYSIEPTNRGENLSDISDVSIHSGGGDHRRPSFEFEDGNDVDLTRKNMKIRINIGSKSMDDMTRKILVDEETKLNRPVFTIRIDSKLDAAPDLPRDFAVVTLERMDVPVAHTVLQIRAEEDTAAFVFNFLRRTAPMDPKGLQDVRAAMKNEKGFYVGSNGPQYTLVIPLPMQEETDNLLPDKERTALYRKYGVLDQVYRFKKGGSRFLKVAFSNIFKDDLMRLIDSIQKGGIGMPLPAFVPVTTAQGLQVYQELFARDPEAVLPHILTVEGARQDRYDCKYLPNIQHRILQDLKEFGARYFVGGDLRGEDVLFICTRQTVVEACLNRSNSVMYGNLIYLSAKNSLDTELKEDIEKQLLEKFGKFEDLIENLGVNRQESEAVESAVPLDRSKQLREIDLFVDGVLGSMTKNDFEQLFNPYGMVIRESHKPDQRFSFVTIITTEEKALQAVKEVTGHERDDNTLVVQISHKDREDLIVKSRQLVKEKLAEVRRKEVERMEKEAEEETPAGTRKFYFYLSGITNPLNKYEVGAIFAPYGKVVKALPTDANKTYSFVDLETTERLAIDAYIEISGREFYGNRVMAQFRNTKGMDAVAAKAKRVAQERLTTANQVLNSLSSAVRGQDGPMRSEMVPGASRRSEMVEYPAALYARQPAKVDIPDSVKALLTAPTSTEDSFRMEYPDPIKLEMSASVKQEAETSGLGLDSLGWSNILAAVSNVSSKSGARSATPQPNNSKGVGPKALRRYHIARLNSNIREFDVKDLFSRYGQINRVDLVKINSGFVQVYMSELMAVKCVCELNGLVVKGSKLLVEFSKGSFEETKEFKDKWADEFKLFSSQEHKQSLDIQPVIPKMDISEIGQGLKNFDMSLSLDPIHPSFQGYKTADTIVRNQGFQSSDFSPVPSPYPLGVPPVPDFHRPPPAVAAAPAPAVNDDYLADIKGKIHSIQNKQILLEFSLPGSGEKALAKLNPGQMYINGRQCLGFTIKSNTYHMWPNNVKEFLQIGKEVWMDLKRLSTKEMHDSKDRDREINWATPFVRLPGSQVSDKDMTISRHTQKTTITTAVVRNLHQTWGILEAKDQLILFKNVNFFWQTAPLKPDVSLASVDVEIGDIVALHMEEDADKVAQFIAANPRQEQLTDSLKEVTLVARLVWQVTAEVDPWVYSNPEVDQKVLFLTSSWTLNRPLPGEKEAELNNVSGTLEEIHLPAAGIVSINEESLGKLNPPLSSTHQHKVYIHRSRVHLNGTKIQTDQSLETELKPGDQVSMDIVRNTPYPSDPPFVMSPAFWVAVAVRANTVVRGVQISNRLKKEVSVGCEDGMERARVVYLAPPSDPQGPVVQGTAIIDTGEYLGQRVEFDRSVCSAYSFSLARADLSHIMGPDETVYVRLKPYNSYCVEKLWLGFCTGGRKEGSLDPQQIVLMKEDLMQKGISQAGFDVLVKGQFSPRNYLPLPRQTLYGDVITLHEKDSFATSMTIKGDCGETISADREKIYVHGHWLGRADLAYCMQGERVCYETCPRYGVEDDIAALVWIGVRPSYTGSGVFPTISSESNRKLNIWLANKGMDLHSFKALIEGMLPSKKKADEAAAKTVGANLNLDPDTLAQAAMLQKMKSQMGKDKVMDLLKTFLDSDVENLKETLSDIGKDSGASSSSKYREQEKYYSSQSTTASFSSSPKDTSSAVYAANQSAAANPPMKIAASSLYSSEPKPPGDPTGGVNAALVAGQSYGSGGGYTQPAPGTGGYAQPAPSTGGGYAQQPAYSSNQNYGYSSGYGGGVQQANPAKPSPVASNPPGGASTSYTGPPMGVATNPAYHPFYQQGYQYPPHQAGYNMPAPAGYTQGYQQYQGGYPPYQGAPTPHHGAPPHPHQGAPPLPQAGYHNYQGYPGAQPPPGYNQQQYRPQR